MRRAFTIAMAGHGVIHLLGFTVGNPVSSLLGVAWLLSAMLFLGTAIRFSIGQKGWWSSGLVAVVASQLLIVTAWSEAWFGTPVNALILAVICVGIGESRFSRAVAGDVAKMYEVSPGSCPRRNSIHDVPAPVRTWLRRSGVSELETAARVSFQQRGMMQPAPGARWMPFCARQQVTMSRPGFVWDAKVDAFPGLYLRGRDKYVAGRGAMRIKALSLFTVASASDARVDSASLLRFLGEMVWYPSAALESYVSWTPLDATTARATLVDGELRVSGVFTFDEIGNVRSFDAKRFRDQTLEDWHIDIDPAQPIGTGRVSLPLSARVSWDNESGRWEWLKVEISDVKYDESSDHPGGVIGAQRR